MTQDFEAERNNMVIEQLIGRGICSEAVLDAMRKVPRHIFVPAYLQKSAYDDSPLPIGWGQTISQPYIVAFMTESLEPFPGMKILEIGTGSGYQAAILSYLGCEVYTIELLEELVSGSKEALSCNGFENVTVRHGNGFAGWPEEAPFDAMIVTAAPERLPDKLVGQLAEGGTMLIPVGAVHSVQSLKIVTKKSGRIVENDLLPVRFVPMVDQLVY